METDIIMKIVISLEQIFHCINNSWVFEKPRQGR